MISARVSGRTRARTEATTLDAAPLKQPVHQLRIFDLHEGDTVVYQYYLESQELQLFNSYRSKPIVGDRLAYVRSLYRKVEEHWISSHEDVEDFTGKLRAYGGQLFDELFPPELQKDLWTHRTKIKSIQVISPEPFIPWELVHLKQPNGSLPRETHFLGGAAGAEDDRELPGFENSTCSMPCWSAGYPASTAWCK